MQLDRTEIVIRKRSTLELFDLSLQVLKRHWLAIAITSALLGIPLLILDSLATAWMLNQNSLDLAEQEGGSAGWRHFWHVATLYTLQFPLVSLPTTVFLGHRIFYQDMPVAQLLRRLWPIAGRCLLVLGIVRLGLVGLVLELLINRQVAFDVAIEFWFFVVAAGVALFNRATSPFAPEILGLELCPLRAPPEGSISYRVRSRALHRYTAPQNLPRFFAAMFFGCLLFCMLIGTQLFISGAITGRWSWNAWFDHCGLQLSLWCVGLFLAVFRFLSYLDNRIRLEGWEIELRLKAEAARLEVAAPVGAAGVRAVRFASIRESRDFLLSTLAPRKIVETHLSIVRRISGVGFQLAFQKSQAGSLLHVCFAGCLVLTAVAALCDTTPLTAAESAVERAAESLPIGDWYDKQTQGFRPPEVAPAEDDTVRTAGSVSQSPPATAIDPQSTDQSWIANWLADNLALLMQTLLFILLAIGLVVLLVWLTYYSLRDYLPERYQRQPLKAVSIDPARIMDLPFESKPIAHDPLSAARQAMQAANYDEAIAYLLGYLLLALDQRRLIHLQRGKTNRMYLRELSNQPSLVAIVNSAVEPFEASYFGKHSVTRIQFMTVWQQVDTFHHSLQTASPTARPIAATASPANTPLSSASMDSTSMDSTSMDDASVSSAGDAPRPGKLTIGLLLGASCLATTAGCGAWSSDAHTYGAVASPGANRSLNGLGLHRKLWESHGAKCSTPSQLSPKLDQADVIVLVGQSYEPPGIEARRWLEQWLASGDRRTLLYFGRDFDADILYRQQTLDDLPSDRRQRGEELLALRQADELRLRWEQLPAVAFCDWFYIDALRATHDYQNFQSDWPYTGQFADALVDDAMEGRWPVGVALQPPDSKLWMDRLSQQIHQMPAVASSKTLPSDINSNSPHAAQDSPQSLRRSRWSPNEFGDSAQWLDALQDPLESEILLAADDGQPLIFRLTSDALQTARLGNGQILIVANGFPVLNGSLVTPLGGQLGQLLIDTCGPAERVALLAFDQRGLMISETDERGLSGAGLEMLTVWPLSAITMPAALLGIIVCAALWPILGRPQPLAKRSVSDLGLHIEAIGRLMSETHDRQYAAGAIDEYFRRVRGEAPPAWLSDVVQTTPPQRDSPP